MPIDLSFFLLTLGLLLLLNALIVWTFITVIKKTTARLIYRDVKARTTHENKMAA